MDRDIWSAAEPRKDTTLDRITRGRPKRQAGRPSGLQHPGGSRPKPRTGTTGKKANGHGLDCPARNKKKKRKEAINN